MVRAATALNAGRACQPYHASGMATRMGGNGIAGSVAPAIQPDPKGTPENACQGTYADNAEIVPRPTCGIYTAESALFLRDERTILQLIKPSSGAANSGEQCRIAVFRFPHGAALVQKFMDFVKSRLILCLDA